MMAVLLEAGEKEMETGSEAQGNGQGGQDSGDVEKVAKPAYLWWKNNQVYLY